MCSADAGSTPTTRFWSTDKVLDRLQKGLGILSISVILWQLEERERPIRTITHSKVTPTTDDYIPRSELSDKLKAEMFSLHGDLKRFFISITGNREVGKSELIRHVLDGYSGVLEVSLDNDKPPRKAIETILGVTDENAVARAFVKAESRLGHKPVVVIDIPERVTDSNVLDAVSNFAKDFGYEKELAKVLVVCSTAGTAAGITGDDRRIDFFVPQFTREELDSADARRVFEVWHGKSVKDEEVTRIFELVGGRIGNIQGILARGNDGTEQGSLDKAIALMQDKLLRDVERYEAIDRRGGIGPEKDRLASWLAHEVARFPFDKCLPFKRVPLSPEDFEKTARDARAHPIYFHPHIKGYCARSPFVHNQLRSVAFQPKSLRSPATAEPASSH